MIQPNSILKFEVELLKINLLCNYVYRMSRGLVTFDTGMVYFWALLLLLVVPIEWHPTCLQFDCVPQIRNWKTT